MTDKNTSSEQPRKETAPAPPPAETKKGTQPLNPGSEGKQKPVSKLDPETQERLQKMLSSRLQSGASAPAEKTSSAPASPAPAQPEKKEPPAGPAPAAKAPGSPAEKSPAWPEPAKTLGKASTPDRPDAAPADPSARASTPSTPGTDTARLNRPPAEPAAGTSPAPAGPSSSGTPTRSKADAQAAIRTTSATRNVPKGRMAQEVWKVIFQGMTGSAAKELGIEVRGLSVVGRADPDGDSKADLDLTSFSAGAYGVSRQHVILIPTDEGPCIIDLNSTNGTWINGLYLEPGRRYRLRTNDRVELGSLKLLVRVMTPAEVGAASEPSGSQSAAGAIKKPDSP